MKLEFINKKEFSKIVNELKELYKICIDKELSEDYLVWRYLKNPMDDLILCIARENDKLVASYSIVPINVKVDDNTIKSGISMPILVNPNFRNNGVSVEIAIKVYRELKEKNYDLILGFPNEIYHYTQVKKFGFEDIYEIPTLKLRVEDKDIYHITRSDLQKIDIDNNYSFDYSLLIKNSANKFKVHKDTNYLKWMFKENPNADYSNYVVNKNKIVLASLIFVKTKNKIEIVELNSIDKEYSKVLLCRLCRDSVEEGIKDIEICCSIYSKEHRGLEELGFKNCTPITYFTMKRINCLSDRINDSKNWNIQISDFRDMF